MDRIVLLLLASAASFVLAPAALAAEVSLSGQSAAPGSSVVIPMEFESQGGPVGGIQFDLQYNSSVMNLAAVLGDAARNSGKSIYFADITPNLRRFLIIGMNLNPMPEGTLIDLFVNLNPNAPDGVYPLMISNIQGADPYGIALASTGASGTIAIQGTVLQSVPIQPTGVLNAGSLLSGAVSPGEVVTLFGSGIGPVSAAQPLNSLSSTALVGTSVLFDGTPAPLLYAGLNQINLVVPYAVSGESATQMQITVANQVVAVLAVPVAASTPAILTLDGSGSGAGAVLNQDSSVNGQSNPAARGSVAVLFATGAGQTDPPGIDGQLPGDPLPKPVLPVYVQVGGVNADVLYAGASPGLINGALQVNFRVPASVTPGSSVPLSLIVGTANSPPGVTLAVQ